MFWSIKKHYMFFFSHSSFSISLITAVEFNHWPVGATYSIILIQRKEESSHSPKLFHKLSLKTQQSWGCEDLLSVTRSNIYWLMCYLLTLHIDSDAHYSLLSCCVVDYTAVLSSILMTNTGSAQNNGTRKYIYFFSFTSYLSSLNTEVSYRL